VAFIDGIAVTVTDLGLAATISDAVTVVVGVIDSTTPPLISLSDLVAVFAGVQSNTYSYPDGYIAGEMIGSTSARETVMPPIVIGETDNDKKTIGFHLYTSEGLPASGIYGQGGIVSPAAGELQTNRDLAGYVNATGTFSHVGDGEYRYTFANSEVSAGSPGNIWLRIKVNGYRVLTIRTPIRNPLPTETEIRDAILNAARSGHVTSGTIGEGVAIGVALLQGNFYMDQVVNTGNGQISSRIRCFHTAAAAAAATQNGTGQGEFATFLVTTSYVGVNNIATHRVVQQ
jgi:hypothetical protein